ncbi:MAG: glycosyltransferase family 2 protein [Spirochaetia bacterium]|nr:glycosyltransferase family 2 protein [Spirochaetia bacterium]
MDKHEVSVVITTYKRPDKLGRAIRSVLNQTLKDWELIIVDDNNADSPFRQETEAFMADYLADSRIRYIKHEKNSGAPEARNTGIKAAVGTYIAFLDDDDEFESTKLERQLALFKSSDLKNLGVVYCKNRYLDETGTVLRYSVAKVRGDVFKYHMVRNVGITSTLMIKKSAIEKAGYFHNIVCAQEYELLLRIFALGYTADLVDDFLTNVYIHDGERITTSKKVIQGRLHIFEVKKGYFDRLTPKEQKLVEHYHWLTMFRESVLVKEYKEARKYWKKAVATKPQDPLNYIEGLSLVVPVSAVNNIKSWLHHIKNRLGK